MNTILQDAVIQRKLQVKGCFPLSTIRVQDTITKTYVDCKACAYAKLNQHALYCSKVYQYIPEEIVPIGCSSGT